MPWSSVARVEVAPSVYAADFLRLGEQLEALLGAGARVIHFDIGDGHFIPPVTIGPVVLRSVAPLVREAGGILDCHLMVDDPAHHVPELAASGAHSVTFHVEVAEDPAQVAALAREHGLAVGIAFSPATPVEAAVAAARSARADLVLCMSIVPGYSGQAFRPDAVERIHRLRELLAQPTRVQVDGGINLETAPLVRAAGADVLVSGSAVFGADDDVAAAYRELVAAVA
jgi:ribulose-phosphate 3-epimerase